MIAIRKKVWWGLQAHEVHRPRPPTPSNNAFPAVFCPSVKPVIPGADGVAGPPLVTAQMRRAVLQARKTVGTFIAALRHPSPGQQDFEVKKAFRQGNEVEHLWLSDVRFSGNRFHGRVDNQPQKIKGVRVDDLVSVNPDEITDWAFVDNGKLVGGYTIRVLYNELSPEQKKQFDQTADFRMDKR